MMARKPVAQQPRVSTDPLAACKAAREALSGHYTLTEWSRQYGVIWDNLPGLIAEVEAARAKGEPA
jgi:hypothetical protein